MPAHRIAAGWIKCEQTSFSRCGCHDRPLWKSD
jgi:hypothetical protein